MTSAVLWADSGEGVGLGHLARTCAVAAELQARTMDVLVFSPDPRGAAFARDIGLTAIEARHGFDQALDAVNGTAVALLDSYRLRDEDYAHARRTAPVLAVFNDDGACVPACDVVINGAPGAERLPYGAAPGRLDLLGALYFPLRREFRDAAPRTAAPEVRRVLVTTGGDDVHGLIGLFGETSRQAYPHARIVAVAGREVRDPGLTAARCDVRVRPSDYPELVRRTDVMICGAGQTLVEAAAAGTPAAAVLLGADQAHQHAAVVAAGAALDGGDWSLSRPALITALRAALEQLRDVEVRAEIARRGQGLIDGRGAGRIAEALIGVSRRSG